MSARAAVMLCAVLSSCASAGAGVPMTLTPQDYIDIQMLSARYAQVIEHCINRGYDYAALYTEDGEFGRTDDFGVRPKEISKGPDALATAAGGGPGGCQRNWPGDGLTHLIMNIVITPTATGAHATSALVILGLNHDPGNIRRIGSYEDTYVKTAAGWRFKTRWHVFPTPAAAAPASF